METNNTNISKKFLDRTFTPSSSAWERLSVQLDEQPKATKKGWIFYAGIAASILVLVTIGFGLFSSEQNQFKPKNEIVIAPIDTTFIDTKIKNLTIDNLLEEAVVNNTKNQEVIEIKKPVEKKQIIETKIIKSSKKIIAVSDNSTEIKTKIETQPNVIQPNKVEQKIISNSVIKVSAADLLFAVTHSQKEVTAYYAKNNINRNELLQSIEKQLKKSNLTVNPNSILAEVEQNINEDTFKSNFLKLVKKKVSDVASAVASRND